MKNVIADGSNLVIGCYGLNMKCPPICSGRSLASIAILRGSRNFRRWSLPGGGRGQVH
jgi:hypothetical protein